MKRWMQLAATVYPRAWRERYGAEMAALIEDSQPQWRDFADLLKGGAAMQLRSGKGPLIVIAALAIAGAVAGGVTAFGIPKRYVSTMVVSAHYPQAAPPAHDQWERDPLGDVASVNWRRLLEDLLNDQRLGLYAELRGKETREELLARFLQDLRLSPLHSSSTDSEVAGSFEYPDPKVAQRVLRRVQERIGGVAFRSAIERRWALQGAGVTPEEAAKGGLVGVRMADYPTLPTKPVSPNRLALMAAGLIGGLLLGVVAIAFWKLPRASVWVAAFGAAGLMIAFGASMLAPRAYTSRAVYRVSPPIARTGKADPFPTPDAVRAQLRTAVDDALAPAALKDILAHRGAGLFKSERARASLDELAARMRRGVTVSQLGATGRGVPVGAVVQFTGESPDDARDGLAYITESVVTRFTAAQKQRADQMPEEARKLMSAGLGPVLQVMDEDGEGQPVPSPRRQIIMSGLAVGLALGMGSLLLRRWRQIRLSAA